MKFAVAAIVLTACLFFGFNTPTSTTNAQQRPALVDGSWGTGAPEVKSLWPPSISRGDQNIRVWIRGENFRASDRITVERSPVTTRIVGATGAKILEAEVPAWMFPAEGYGQISIIQSSGREIEAGEITIVPESRKVAVRQVSPESIAPGYSGFEFELHGRGLRQAATVLVAGVAARSLAPPTDDRAKYEVFLAPSLLVESMDVPVQVFDTVGALVRSVSIRVSSKPSIAPMLTSISPDTVGAGEPGFTLTVNGTNFDPKVAVTLDGKSLTLDSVTPTVVKAIIARDLIRTKGDKTIVATNPGKQKSNELKLRVTDPVFTITSISPDEVFAGGPDVLVNVFGNNIPSNAAVKINDQALPDGITLGTQSADRIDIRVTASQIAQAGSITFQIIKPPPDENGTATVLTATLQITDEKAVVSTLAGFGFAGFTDGPIATAQFAEPASCAVDSSGKIWVVDFFNHAIRRVDINAGLVQTIAGNGTSGFVDGTVTPAILAGDAKKNPVRFNFPIRILIDRNDTVYITEIGNESIRRIRPLPDGSFIVDTLAGTSKTSKKGLRVGVSGFADGPALQAKFDSPDGMALARDGTMYVADALNLRIRKITALSTSPVVSTLAGGGKRASLVNKVGTEARFTRPTSVSLLPDESALLVGDIFTPRTIRKITLPDVKVTTFVNGAGGGAAQDGGSATTDLVATITAIRFKGNFAYLADDINVNAIRRLDLNGAVITAAGKVTSLGGGLLDGPAFGALFNSPRDLCFLPNGSIVVVDQANHRLRLIEFRP